MENVKCTKTDNYAINFPLEKYFLLNFRLKEKRDEKFSLATFHIFRRFRTKVITRRIADY